MDRLYTNRNATGDFHINGFRTHGKHVTSLHAAVAFLTAPEPLLELAEAGVKVRVVVRLGYPTSPRALKRLVEHPQVLVNATTSPAFHPKLYIFQDRCALVGSANMTNAALWTNQEVSVEVPAADPLYAELSDLFDLWWAGSRVLDEDLLESYEKAFVLHSPSAKARALEKAVKDLAPGNLSDVDKTVRKKASRADLDFREYQRTYQELLSGFSTLRAGYESTGIRVLPELPLRLEVDAFLGWLREAHATGDLPDSAPTRTGTDFIKHLVPLVQEWGEVAEEWTTRNELESRLSQFQEMLGKPESIKSASAEQIVDTLLNAHAVGDRLRYYKGGRPTQRANMLEKMPEDRLHKTLTYLLHGKPHFIERLARCLRDPEWKLAELGRSGVQEVFGWVNSDDIPICNERTLKSMRWLGLDVRVLG